MRMLSATKLLTSMEALGFGNAVCPISVLLLIISVGGLIFILLMLIAVRTRTY
jgi:hypothetical protein